MLVFNYLIEKGKEKYMETKERKTIFLGITFIFVFALWTWLVQIIDVKPEGVNGTEIGFATINTWYHSVTGVNMTLYDITDWLGLVPVFVCIFFGVLGFIQLLKRKSLFKVDYDIIFLGVYYVIVISAYLIFEMIRINYRPILINGFLEASYPSSTTLLVLSVMPTLIFQANRRLKKTILKKIITIITTLFTAFMVVGRLVSGVHWLTDIIGSVFLSVGLFYFYKGITLWNLMKNCRN